MQASISRRITEPVADAPRGKRTRRRWLKPAVAVAAFVPAAVIASKFALGRLGPNPIAESMNELGLWTLILLLCSLACTPLKHVFGWNWPLLLRKTLGLCAFSYACLHFLVYLVLDQFFAWDEILKDIVKRKFITVGFLALLLLVPLAVTSTNKMVKRLGFPRWKRLHRLVYVSAVLGIIHFIWRVKADTSEPLLYGGVLLLLFALRALPWLRARRGSPASRAPA
jgi:sulfoxide reductase heme-binding subunit YedZ